MVVDFYTCSDDPRVVDKDLDYIYQASSCQVYDGCSILSPVIYMRYNDTVPSATYMGIPEWGRYYRIDDIRVDNGKRMYISGSVDPLYTYRAQIRQCNCNVVRNGGIGRPTYVPDSSLPLYPESDYVTSLSIADYVGPATGDRYFWLSTK